MCIFLTLELKKDPFKALSSYNYARNNVYLRAKDCG